MKKLIRLIGLLMIASAMMLAGCKSNPDDKEKLPGRWTSSVTYLDTEALSSLYTKSGAKFVYTKSSYKDNEDPGSATSFNYSFNYATSSDQPIYTGFKANASSSPDSSIYGFTFNMNYDFDKGVWSYYALFIQENTFNVSEVLNGGENKGGTSRDVVDWQSWSSIKPAAEGNEVIVFTDEEGNIIIRFNDEENAGIIRNPVLKKGMCGVIGTITYNEFKSKTEIKSTYDFKEFQY